VQSQTYIPTFEDSSSSGNYGTLHNWLTKTGPSFHDNFHDPRWIQYKLDLRRHLSEPTMKRWLSQPIGIFLTREEQEGIPNSRRSNRPDSLGDLLTRREGRFVNDEEAQDRTHQDIEVQEPLNRYGRVRRCLYNRLYAALAPAVCILNIASAIGCVILANYSSEQADGVFIGSVLHL
jgi:hypothetical protein